MNRGGNMQHFAAKAMAGSAGLYLRASDFESQRKFRPLPWVLAGSLCDVLAFQEGWVDVEEYNEKTKKTTTKNKPIRFAADVEDYGAQKWHLSSFKGEKEKPQTPKPTLAFVAWDFQTSTIKIPSFNQAGIVKQISACMSPTNEDGSENEIFEPDLTKCDIIIKKVDDKNYSVVIRRANDGIPKEALDAMSAFQWSWDDFMASENPQENGFTFDDVFPLLGEDFKVSEKAPKSKPKNTPKPSASSEESSPVDWKKLKTPQGRFLGDCSLSELEGFEKLLKERKKNVDNPLYDAIVQGIKELSDTSSLADEGDVAF